MVGRSVKEWVGKTNDSPVPDRVRIRVLERFGRRCDIQNHGCGRLICPGDAWICDHIKAIINNGENRESNLHPLCEWCNPKKNSDDAKIKSKTYEAKKRHHGIRKSKTPFRGWRKFNKEVVINPAWKERRGGRK